MKRLLHAVIKATLAQSISVLIALVRATCCPLHPKEIFSAIATEFIIHRNTSARINIVFAESLVRTKALLFAICMKFTLKYFF
jgi:hypothetical protein